MSCNSKLVGKKILIVEDDALVATGIELTYLRFGCVVVGNVRTLREGMYHAFHTETDLVSSTIWFENTKEDSRKLTEILRELKIPFIHLTAYNREQAAPFVAEGDIVAYKPYIEEDLEKALLAALARKR